MASELALIILPLATTVGTIAAAVFIGLQVVLLRKQNQVHALMSLDRVWNSQRLLRLRARWASDERDLDGLEPILEFLEEFAGLRRRRGVLDDRLVWDSTIGWHAVRYYLYNRENGNIPRLRAKWLDETLYQNLDAMWQGYVRVEGRKRSEVTEENLERQIRDTKEKFLAAESNAAEISGSSN